MAPRGQATGFVPAQLYTMSNTIEKAQYAAVERGPDTFTLLSYTKTYAAMEYTPPIPPRQDDRWLQTMATTVGQVLGFATPPKPAQSKHPRVEHRADRKWRLEAPNMALTMGVSSNRGIPQYFWLQGKKWLVPKATKHLTPKGLDAVLGAEESAQPAEPQRAQQAPQPPTGGQAGRDTARPYDEVMRRAQMQEAAQAPVGGPSGQPRHMAAQPPLRDTPPPPYTPRREVYHSATSAPRQDPRAWARPSEGDRSKGRGGKGHPRSKVCAVHLLKRAHFTYRRTMCRVAPPMPSLCTSAIVGERAPMTIIGQPAARRDDQEHRPSSAGEMHLVTDTRTRPVPRADTRQATGHQSELPGSSAVTGVHSPMKTLTVPHTPGADRADHAHCPITVGEMHLVTGIQSRPMPKCLAATQLLYVTDVTHAQCQSILLSNQDTNDASSITFACRPMLSLARGRRGARH